MLRHFLGKKELSVERDLPSLLPRVSLKMPFGVTTGPNGFDVGKCKTHLRPELLRLVKQGKPIKRRLKPFDCRPLLAERTGPNYHKPGNRSGSDSRKDC